MEQGKPFLLRILTFNYLRGYLVENPIQTLIIQCHIVLLVWFIKRAWAAHARIFAFAFLLSLKSLMTICVHQLRHFIFLRTKQL